MTAFGPPGMTQSFANGVFTRQRKRTIVNFGDSRTQDEIYIDLFNAWSTDLAWFDMGQHFCAGGPRFEVVKNAGIHGDTTAGMRARFATDVLTADNGKPPGFMTLWGGTNDDWSGGVSAVDVSYANMVAIMEQARTAGIYTFLISETTSSNKTAAFPPLVQYYNDRLRSYAATHSADVEFWDFNAVIMNPASTTGNPLSTMLSEGLHLSPAGASTIAAQVVAAKLARFPAIVSLTNSLMDTQSVTAVVGNVLPHPLMDSTSGTGVLGANASGTTPPDGWTVFTSSANVTAVVSKPARADGFGTDLQVVATATAAGRCFESQPISVARLVAGNRYVIECDYTITSPVGLYTCEFTVQLFRATRTDTATVTSGSAVVADTAITALDAYRGPIAGTGIPANTFIGTITPGVGFRLSSTQFTQTDVLATANGTSVVIPQTAYQFGHGPATKSPTGIAATDCLAAGHGVLRTQAFAIPTGFTISTAQVLLTQRFSTAGSVTFKFGRISIRPADQG